MLKEPFIHFLILGIILFTYFQLNQLENNNTKQIINLSKYEIMQLKIEYKKQFQRETNSVELQTLIDNEIFEKILLKEAQSLNLDTKDKVITQRLVEKMKFIMANKSAIIEPSEEDLFTFYKNNITEYSYIENLSFVHIFLDTRDIQKAKSLLNIIKISHVKAQNASSFSDKFNGYAKFKNINKTQLTKEYGKYFTNKIFYLKSGVWSEPILSKYGYHLINITNKNVLKPYDFNEIQDRVYKDFLAQRKEDTIIDSYKRFALQYEVKRIK